MRFSKPGKWDTRLQKNSKKPEMQTTGTLLLSGIPLFFQKVFLHAD